MSWPCKGSGTSIRYKNLFKISGDIFAIHVASLMTARCGAKSGARESRAPLISRSFSTWAKAKGQRRLQVSMDTPGAPGHLKGKISEDIARCQPGHKAWKKVPVPSVMVSRPLHTVHKLRKFLFCQAKGQPCEEIQMKMPYAQGLPAHK